MARNSVGLLSSFRRSIEVSTLRCTGCQRPNSQRRPLHIPTSWTTPRSPSPLPKEYSLRPALLWIRHASTSQSSTNIHAARQQVYASRNRSLLMYTLAVIFLGVGVTYAAVPLYRVFCSATGFAGTPLTDKTKFSADRLIPDASSERVLRIGFNADASDALPWAFSPQQKEVYVKPGETALAFYKAKNRSDKDIIGIATYNVTPDKVAPYFAKVECFCFEEQRLLANEEVDLPVFFFIDRDFEDDPLMKDVQDIVLSYTFFRARRNDRGHLVPDTQDAK